MVVVLCVYNVHECFYIFLMASYQQSILGRWGKLADASDDFLIKVQSGSTVKKGYWGCRSMKMGFFVVRNLFGSRNLRRNNGNQILRLVILFQIISIFFLMKILFERNWRYILKKMFKESIAFVTSHLFQWK